MAYRSMAQLLAENLKDSDRFAWFFTNRRKPSSFGGTYLKGYNEKWTLTQWRAAIDKAMEEEKGN